MLPPAPRMYPESFAAQIIDQYGLGFNTVFAISANLLIMVILRRPRMRSSPINLYLMSMAVVDIMFIMVGLLGRFWISSIIAYPAINNNQILCKFWFYGYYLFESSSDWILACMSGERCLAILAPLKSKAIITKKVTITLLCVIHLFLVGIFGNVFIFFGITPYKLCTALDFPTADIFREWLNPVMIVYMPSMIIFVCNIAIACELVRVRILRRQLVQTSDADQDQVRSTVSMLLSVSLVFIILKAPRQVYGSSNVSRSLAYYFPTHHQAVLRLLWAISLWVGFFNHCINFVVYVISGRVFRNELKVMLFELCTKVRHSRCGAGSGGQGKGGDNTRVKDMFGPSPASSTYALSSIAIGTGADELA